jgi:hypothetical protein
VVDEVIRLVFSLLGRGQLREHQVRAIIFVTIMLALTGVYRLFDDVGLGKTIVVLVYIKAIVEL